jgi:hypothetical protein
MKGLKINVIHTYKKQTCTISKIQNKNSEVIINKFGNAWKIRSKTNPR